MLPSVCLISLKNTLKTHRALIPRARVRKRTPAEASVLACAYQLKVLSKNPTDFEYWFRQQLMSKIRNDFIKQHQRGRWRYLSLLAQSVGARFSACA